MEYQLDLTNLQRVLSGSKQNDAGDIDRVLSILAQVSLAVLIIFVMIAILFSSKYKEEAKYWEFRADGFARTLQSKALVDLQRQKLLLALERTNYQYKRSLGHLTFFKINEQNERVVNTENIISGRQIRGDFIEACNFAQKKLTNFEKFKKDYIKIVISRAELAEDGIKVTPEVLDKQNREWFRNQVRGSTTTLYGDTIKLQEDSKEGLAKYYQENSAEVKKLQEMADILTEKLNPTMDDINSFIKAVNIFVEDELQRQNVKFLHVTQETEG